MNLIFATTEAAPFVKTGGLGDVCGALPVELARLGDEVTLILPAFRQVFQSDEPIEPVGVDLAIPIGRKTVHGRVLKSKLPGSEVPVYLIEQGHYFDRPEPYREAGEDYKDNCERFTFFCRAVMETIVELDLPVDVIHAHDWQAGLVPALLQIEYRPLPKFGHVASVFTIHNLAYQGNFWHWDMAITGLDWKYFNWRQMEFFGSLSFMKTGLAFADALTTVSPRYAEEIQSSPLGCGMEGTLTFRRDDLYGIINGVDYRAWNPASDPHLPANYDVDSLDGKAKCKAELQREVGLPVDENPPLIGIVGRLVDQKGVDLIAQILPEWASSYPAQWVLLGTGEPGYHELFSRLAKQFPDKVAARLEFSNPIAHRIEAGADMFLMPSRYEPCGLNQLYSLRYGTVPVVRATGGLADTIVGATPETLDAGQATGFVFHDYSGLALSEALHRACETYRQPDVWKQIVQTGMRQDWSWARSAREYHTLYESVSAKAKQTTGAM